MLKLGQVVATRNAISTGVDLISIVSRHANGDWGNLEESDRRANYQAIEVGLRVLSRYDVGGHSFYVITEADRSATTVLLVEDY